MVLEDAFDHSMIRVVAQQDDERPTKS